MNGAIRTREKCCQPFQETSKGLRCPNCKARPETYYIDFWWKGDRIRVPRDKDGNIFSSYEAANRFLTVMRSKVDEKTFNPKDYIKVEVKKLEFATYAMAWVARRQKEVNQELLSRGIPLYPETIKALKAITQGDPEDFVFTFRRKPFNHKLIDKTWRRATQAAGIKIRLYHGTRHSAASQAVSAGADLKVVQAVLGHSCISSTQRYAHLHPSALLKFWDLQEDRHKTVTEVEKMETKVFNLKGIKG